MSFGFVRLKDGLFLNLDAIQEASFCDEQTATVSFAGGNTTIRGHAAEALRVALDGMALEPRCFERNTTLKRPRFR